MARRKTDTGAEPETTGHEWDGIEELNKPLPKWWLYVFYGTVIWSIGYWLLMPSWPLLSSYTKGLLGYSQREKLAGQLEAARTARSEYRAKIAASDLAAISADPELLRFALASGEAAFGDNCAPCHGRGAQGGFGYPNLRDDSWLFSGTLDGIQKTILYGIRADHPKTHGGMMPGFGKSGLLSSAQIGDVTEYVVSLSGNAHDQQAAERGAKVFAQACASCHGPQGKGNHDLGAPDLTDQLWLYGGEKATIGATIHGGRTGMMPAWVNRLDPETIKELAIYVHALGGGE